MRLKLPGEDREMPHKRAGRHRVPWTLRCRAERIAHRARRSFCAVVLRRWAQLVRICRRFGPHRLQVVRTLRRWEAAARGRWFQRGHGAARLRAIWQGWALLARETTRRAVLSF